MHVNLLVHVIAMEHTAKTDIQVVAHVHEGQEIIGSATLHHLYRQEQRPADDTNLNLWAIAILRGLVANMEETFVYVDQRPPAILIKDAIEQKRD